MLCYFHDPAGNRRMYRGADHAMWTSQHLSFEYLFTRVHEQFPFSTDVLIQGYHITVTRWQTADRFLRGHVLVAGQFNFRTSERSVFQSHSYQLTLGAA